MFQARYFHTDVVIQCGAVVFYYNSRQHLVSQRASRRHERWQVILCKCASDVIAKELLKSQHCARICSTNRSSHATTSIMAATCCGTAVVPRAACVWNTINYALSKPRDWSFSCYKDRCCSAGEAVSLATYRQMALYPTRTCSGNRSFTRESHEFLFLLFLLVVRFCDL
jgi:hypothetical protein